MFNLLENDIFSLFDFYLILQLFLLLAEVPDFFFVLYPDGSLQDDIF